MVTCYVRRFGNKIVVPTQAGAQAIVRRLPICAPSPWSLREARATGATTAIKAWRRVSGSVCVGGQRELDPSRVPCLALKRYQASIF